MSDNFSIEAKQAYIEIAAKSLTLDIHRLLEIPEDPPDDSTALEQLISATQQVAHAYKLLCSLIQEKTGTHIHWPAVVEETEEATKALPIRGTYIDFRTFDHPVASLLIHKDLLPFIDDLRCCAPGRSDSAVASELARQALISKRSA